MVLTGTYRLNNLFEICKYLFLKKYFDFDFSTVGDVPRDPKNLHRRR